MKRVLAAGLLLLTLSLSAFAQTQSSAWIRGTWEGTGYQIDDNSTWTMRLTANRKFLIEYPSLNCSGTWRLISLNANRARFKERISTGKDACANNGRVVIERLSRSQIVFLYYQSGSREVSASAVLKRKRRGSAGRANSFSGSARTFR